jgi:hypothetical protein
MPLFDAPNLIGIEGNWDKNFVARLGNGGFELLCCHVDYL